MIRNVDGKWNGSLSRTGDGAEWKDLVASAAETREHLVRWLGTLGTQARERPGQAVGLAVGAGFVLGGGLLTGLTFKVARASLVVAFRVAAVGASLRLLARAAQGAKGGLDVSSPV